jgi:hypothetical protein
MCASIDVQNLAGDLTRFGEIENCIDDVADLDDRPHRGT